MLPQFHSFSALSIYFLVKPSVKIPTNPIVKKISTQVFFLKADYYFTETGCR